MLISKGHNQMFIHIINTPVGMDHREQAGMKNNR